MTSCPDERLLLALVDGEPAEGIDAARTESALCHLADCVDCQALLGRSEAALRFALGGLEDGEVRPAATRRARRRRVGLAAAAAALVAGALAVLPSAPREPSPGPKTSVPVAVRDPVDRSIERLLGTAHALAAPLAPDDGETAYAALAAAEARRALGLPTADARLADVVERFPGSAAAREARALLAAGTGR